MNDKRQGKGTLTRLDQSRLDAELVGSVYVGEWQDDKISGCVHPFYSSTFLHSRCSYGKYADGNGATYEGMWSDGVRNGRGIYVGKDGVRYEGGWVDDKRSGRARVVLPNGNVFIGSKGIILL